MEVLSYRPDPAEFAWTFGGVPPVRRVRPGSILLDSFTFTVTFVGFAAPAITITGTDP